MRKTPQYTTTDEAQIKRLIRENPWATYVSNTSAGLVASHYPTLLEEDPAGISIVTHFGRPDEVLHEVGEHEMLVIIQGAHGYISPAWYAEGDFIPTWNHVTAHLYGVPEILSDDENFAVLGKLVDHFEGRMPHPVSLDQDEETARRIAKGTIGLRIRVTRVDARLKLSQNKSDDVRATIIDALHGDGAYAQPALADEMERLEPHP
ncbi:MAG: FMN-binding negative transcriptional regulator [Pseudolysinimonas sp.]